MKTETIANSRNPKEFVVQTTAPVTMGDTKNAMGLIGDFLAVADRFMDATVRKDGKGRLKRPKTVRVHVIFYEDACHPSNGFSGIEAGNFYECSGKLRDIVPAQGYLTVEHLTIPFSSIQQLQLI